MVSNKFDVSGKCCIITGGTRGLGRGMAEGLLENGAKVVMMARGKEKLDEVVQEFKANGYEAFGVSGDVSDRKELSRMFDEAFELLGGRIDVLIPAAGIQRRNLPEQFPEEMWDEVINTNLHHVWFACQKVLPLMLKQYQQDNSSRGKIILIGSMVSWFGGTTVPAYTAAKGAVTQLTKSLAVDCAGRGININALAPGYMDTEMNANLTDARKAEISQRIPQVAWGLPEDMKGPVLFLSSAASDYINGAIIPVDGGYLCK